MRTALTIGFDLKGNPKILAHSGTTPIAEQRAAFAQAKTEPWDKNFSSIEFWTSDGGRRVRMTKPEAPKKRDAASGLAPLVKGEARPTTPPPVQDPPLADPAKTPAAVQEKPGHKADDDDAREAKADAPTKHKSGK